MADAIKAGFPVLLDFSYPGGGHFAVATAYDPNLDVLELKDPNFMAPVLLDRDRFVHETGYTKHLNLVICPEDKLDALPPANRLPLFTATWP